MSLGSAAFLKKELTGNYGVRSIGRLHIITPYSGNQSTRIKKGFAEKASLEGRKKILGCGKSYETIVNC